MIDQQLFNRACRISCTVNNKDPDEYIPNPYGDPCDGDSLRPRWQWVSEVCGKEIRAIIEETKREYNIKDQ